MKTNQFWLTLSLAIIFSLNAYSQVIKVSGIVTDETDSPLIGVSVIEKGSKNATITDVNGKYSITIEKGKTLIFSYIGYEKKELKVTGEKLNVKLISDSKTLNEVVISSNSIAIKRDVTDAVAVGYGRKSETSRMPMVTQHINFDYDALNAEEYDKFKENRFISVGSEPLSTFSLDVDAASYGNIRRIINQGKMPEKDAVRIEEMLNYFSYSYEKPTSEHPVKITTEGTVCPWNTKHKIVRIGVKVREIPSENLPASNFVFLIDVSGSMYGPTRLELVKSSLKLLVNNLREKDRVAIVVYAGAAGEALPSTSGSDKQKIIEALQNLTAGGSTAGGAGIQLAYRIAEKNFMKGGNNRIILCTDGDFNVGVSSNEQLESLIEEKRSTGIYLTVLGYGMGNYKDSKLQTLAQKGNGNHAYIDNIQEANKVLVNEFGGTMFTVAKDVKLQVEFNPAYVNAYRLIGYESRLLNKEDFNDDTKDAGDLGAGHTVTALYEIIPAGVENTFGGVDNLKYQKEKNTKVTPNKDEFNNEMLNVKLRYKKPDSDKSVKMEVPLVLSAFESKTTEDMNFAMAVAMFGQLLRKSDFKGNATYSKVAELACTGLGVDNNGYRREFVRLVEAVKQMED